MTAAWLFLFMSRILYSLATMTLKIPYSLAAMTATVRKLLCIPYAATTARKLFMTGC